MNILEETKEAQIFVVCGSNRKIETGMKKEFQKEERDNESKEIDQLVSFTYNN